MLWGARIEIGSSLESGDKAGWACLGIERKAAMTREEVDRRMRNTRVRIYATEWGIIGLANP